MSAPATSTASTTRPVAALPALPNDANISPQLLARLQAVVERIATLDGQRGDALDAALTRRELVEVGLLKTRRGGNGIELDTGFSGGWTNIPYLDYMPTPAPPTFETGIGVNFLFWILPNARGVGATQIFRRTNDTDGTIIAAPVGAMYADLPVEYATTYYYKIRFVSERGVAGDWSSEVTVVSEADPTYLIEVLQGKISESELAQGLRERVDVGGIIDQALGGLSSDIDSVNTSLTSELQRVDGEIRLAISEVDRVTGEAVTNAIKDVESASETALLAATEINRVRTEMREAGIEIDTASGKARIFALDETANRTSALAIELDAVKSTLTQKVTYSEVLSAISDATLDPTQLPEIGDIRGRVNTLESEMDGVQGSITQKASTTDLNATNIRVTTAENRISSVEGVLADKVSTVEFTNLDTRVTTAENVLSTFDGAEIANAVGDIRLALKKEDGTAESILNSLLAGNDLAQENAELVQELAFAKETLTAKIEDGLSAEAQSRLILSTQISDVSASLINDYYTKSTVDDAVSSAKLAAIASANGNTATMLNSYYTKAGTDSAIAEADRALAARIYVGDENGNPVALEAGFSEKVRVAVDASGVAKATFESKVTAGQRTAGFAYGTDGNVSEFYIMADRFAVLSSAADSTPTTPFIVEGDNTYINSAIIKDASIDIAKIKDLNATVATIAKANIYDAAVGGQIYSSNYNLTTKTGWSLNQDGSAFFGGNTTFGGKLEVRRVGSGAGVDITNDGIRVYDANGVLRVAIGKLT
jgi:hypothetical protein